MDDTLVLLQPSTSNTPTPSESRVLLFRSSSAIPYRSHTIPFRISNSIWYETASARLNFSLVGITDTWSVVLFGDDVEKSAEDGSTLARTISVANASPRKNTIFQEMFGISAFSDFKQTLPSNTSSVPLFPSRDKKQSASAIFDAPAYLIPPLESLFDPLISNYLQLRSENQGVLTPNRTEDSEDEEAKMDVDEEVSSTEKPFLVGDRPERIVDAQEMNGFVELFKHYGLTCKS
jgi:NET1-associated nuclear protein 1 (U3 small nucleolar RNA-associated protein 17)